MIRTVAINPDSEMVSSISQEGSMNLGASITEHNNWQDVDYLIFCQNSTPSWIAKIHELVFPRRAGEALLFRFSEIRSLEDLSDEKEEKKNELLKPFFAARKSGKWPLLTEFESDEFFTVGDPLPFCAQPRDLGPLHMDKAVLRLAKTYGVDPDQVEITIRSKSVSVPPNVRAPLPVDTQE
ncbi:hypothetical protein [Pseudomonas fluorescens]|jgi:hypothetical protein|uniref:hypothetical protein n=1 Tax=Pseudomonas fluorescens TaxID=294 RepID=UPI00054C132B|nr:hypothetical protein [Pseudomonas fluorescens]KII36837.1 hypothetical protein RY26_07380 [Pseudomonas fluorescens]